MICGALLEQGWRVCLVGETGEGGGKTLAKKEVKNEKGKREIQSANCGGEVSVFKGIAVSRVGE
jgi:hypothetical protein